MTLSPQEASAKALEICQLAPIIPVLVVEDVSRAASLARALVKGGLPALEVTLRTADAFAVITEMSKVEGGVVGAGTLLTPDDVKRARDAGATFGVSPGATDKLLTAAEDVGLPMLPGAVTASEVMALLERGYDMLKFFPASTSGGAPAIKNLGGPLQAVKFCPTGGVSPSNATEYLSLSNVVCAGGSWVAPGNLVKAEKWDDITALAAAAAALPR
ncbi:2-dehydro-3-deoxyphosphogluconate aldolase/4-hydroxy-2-oxoglutarate aldolase [Rhodobacterales bacterium HTCC2150]|nr:2-dehydro-3-deoxyphosphogluconate aldolase/4-hydroxy-2-oxoglutarate aldolase [Rhodobacterales bacterium HTCC2150] [Rhodobacteraceae bacterium HTCC2150]